MHLDWPRSGNNLANPKLDDCSTMKTWKKIVKDHDHVVCRSRTKGTFLISSGVVDRTLQIIMKIRATCTADFLRPLHKSSFAKATCYKRVLLLRVFFERIWGKRPFLKWITSMEGHQLRPYKWHEFSRLLEVLTESWMARSWEALIRTTWMSFWTKMKVGLWNTHHEQEQLHLA